MVLLKIALPWLLSWCNLAVRKIKTYATFLHHRNTIRSSIQQQQQYSMCPSISNLSLEGRDTKGQTLVCNLEGTLLRTSSLFPYFMLVAFEGGSLVRALILLFSVPLLWLLGHDGEPALRVMTFITFCGLRTRDLSLVARTVLPKFYLENLHLQACEVLQSSAEGKSAVFTALPRAIAEGFLREYLHVGAVVGGELEVANGGRYFTGLLRSGTSAVKQKAVRELIGEEERVDVALVSSCNHHDLNFFNAHSKQCYLINKDEQSSKMPRSKYPKPLIFHDGRLAFLPTPSSVLVLFLWLPLAPFFAAFRIFIGILPFKLSIMLAALCGIKLRVQRPSTPTITTNTKTKGVLYVCTHRTLLDPVMLSNAIQRTVPAVTYSLSRTSELLSPIRTVRLTRDRAKDAQTMRRLLRDGDLVVCPEGTTCREPYLLRFSSLFVELADEIVPVAIDCKGFMFYGTTATGSKWLDPFMFMMNPVPEYRVELLRPVQPERMMGGGMSAAEVANEVQRLLGEVLGFECTALTRRDKYLMLAGHEGLVGGVEGKCKRG